MNDDSHPTLPHSVGIMLRIEERGGECDSVRDIGSKFHQGTTRGLFASKREAKES